MKTPIFTIVAVCAVFFAIFLVMLNSVLALYLLGGVLVLGVGLGIYRIKFGA